ALVDSLTALGIHSHAIDGYITGAHIYIDENNNGVLDDGEYETTADISGTFALPADAPFGTLVVDGGTDLLTGDAFQGVMKAPPGSTVVTPFPTMVVDLLQHVVGSNVTAP